MKNAQKIIMNQYLTPRPIFSNVKSLLILPVLLAVLFIVTACGGAAVAPTLIESPRTDDSCTTDPFGDGCDTAAAETAQDIKITECLAGEAAATSTCESAVKSVPCLNNPFDTACANNADFAKYLTPARTARTTLCTSNPFNGLCTADPVARLTFCRDTGRATATKATDCTGTINTACAADRFIQTTGTTVGNLCSADPIADLAFCRDATKTTATKADDCTATIADACINNAFDMTCTPDHAAELAFCNDETKITPTKIADCATTISGACTDNPFTALCTDDLMARLTFCRDTDATSDNKATDCTGTITTACTANPFTQTTGTTVGDLCVGNDLPDEDGITAFCRDATKPTDTKTTDCAPTVERICTTQGATPDPFEVLCTITDEVKIAFCRDGTNAVDRADDCMTVITPLCEANSGDPLCPDDDTTKITAGDWSRSFDAPLNTAPDLANLKSGFLQIADKTIETSGLKRDVNAFNADAEMLVEPTVHSMNFSTSLFDGLAIGGNADNGFTHFNARSVDNPAIYHFAGIYGSTDLGAPLTLNNNLNATWNGRIQLNSFPADFVLSVGFDGTNSTGTLDGFVVNYARTSEYPTDDGDLLIDGTFDENGLISGTVTLAGFADNVKTGAKLNDVSYEANLTGIIGADGAVGVFFREGTFAGGFIAGPNIVFNPNVTYSDWTRSFTATPLNYDPAAENQFLRTTGNLINVDGTFAAAGGGGDTSVFTLDFSAFTSDGVSLGLSADDGLAYFRGEVQEGGETNIYAYAGIYETTDLGAPIATPSFSATWAGIAGISESSPTNFDLAVTFTGTTGTVDGFIVDSLNAFDLLIDGEFDAKGVITGGVHFAEFAGNDKEAITDRDGTLSGIIGQEGAVGVFHGTTEDYSGGFIASPVVTICAKDVFDTDCPVNTDVPAQTAFCTNQTDNGGTNPFNAGCGPLNGTEIVVGTNNARRDVCLADVADTLTDPSCAMDTLAEGVCELDPFMHPGCENLTANGGYRTAYCVTDTATIFNPNCGDMDAYGDTNNARDTVCEMYGTVVAKGGHASCADRLNITTACTAATPYANTGCNTATGIGAFRITYCTTTNIFDTRCAPIAGNTDTIAGTNDARDTACEMHGTVVANGGDASCASRQNIVESCTRDPFSSTGCNTATDIATVRTRYCTTAATSFNSKCIQGMHGDVKTTRDNDCLAKGTNAGVDNDCATREIIVTTCTLDPFTVAGCATAAEINTYRTNYCTIGANIFDIRCAPIAGNIDIIDGTNVARDKACLDSGTAGAGVGNDCADRDIIVSTCTADPFTKAGCATATNIDTYRTNYCTMGANIFNASCGDADLYGGTNAARDTACLLLGTNAGTGNDCATRPNVVGVCDGNPYTQTGDGTTGNLCTTQTYITARMNCETADVGSFAENCNSQDLMGDVQTARDTYCGAKMTNLSEATNNCVSRLAATCTTNDGTAPFAGICGTTVTPQQITACEGTLVDLTAKGALASDCHDDLLSGAICGRGTTPGTNPFAEICDESLAILSGFEKDKAQDAYCRASEIEAEGSSTGVCSTIKLSFCDGMDATDNPYAPLCGTNRANQESFCESHRRSNAVLCMNSRATVCPITPFVTNDDTDCFASGGNSYATDRAAQCSDGTETMAARCDTTEVSDLVCITTGTNANPFATFCADGTDKRSDTTTMSIAEVRQAVLSACGAGVDTLGVCANTKSTRDRLRDTDCVVTNPSALFADGCDYTEFKGLEVDYCAATGNANAWLPACNGVADINDRVKTARDNACLASGTNAGTGTDCATRQIILDSCTSADPFAYVGCNTATHITPEIREAYCTTGTTNIFNPKCAPLDGNDIISGTNDARFAVCHANPFNTNCVATYLVLDPDRLAFCRDASRNPAGKAGNCATDRPLIIAACNGNPGDPVCDDDDVTKVTAGDWTRAQPALLNTDPDTTSPKAQFLKIAEDTISIVGVTGFNDKPVLVQKLDFSEFSYGGVSLNLSDNNGFSSFFGSIGGPRFDYVGIYGSTDLGAPITDDIVSATWAAKFQYLLSTSNFTLDVAFNGTNRTGTVDGFIKNFSGGVDFLIDGEFDAKGVITGDVHAAEFNNDMQTEIADGDHSGILSGIIGSDGAVGVFHGILSGHSYSGGFIASPAVNQRICGINSGDPICPDDDVTKVTAGDWTRAQPALLNTDPTAKTQFLKIADKTISDTADDFTKFASTQTLDFSEFTSGGVSLGLDDDNGLANFRGSIDNTLYHYAGIYGSTDLGLPITDSGMNTTWAAKFQYDDISKDFDLAVTFDGTTGTGTVDGFIKNFDGGFDFLIDGEFDAKGVITGYVHSANFASETSPATPTTFNGTLSGIIGLDGAVGVFVSGSLRFSGGFIASAEATRLICAMDSGDPICSDDDVTKVTASDWERVRESALNTNPTAKNQFLKIAGNEISKVAVSSNPNGTGITPVFTLDFSDFTYNGVSLGLDADDGLAHFQGYFSGTTSLFDYAGIFGNTDLGAPIVNDIVSATWAGKSRLGSHSKDFDLKVTFSSTTGTGTVDAFIVDFFSTNDFLIDGEFDANGVITGYAHLAAFDGNTPTSISNPNGTLSGIIGSDGAVGVFHGTSGYAGGFIALPDVNQVICAINNGYPVCDDDDVTKITGGDWSRSFAEPLNTNPTAAIGQFLQIVGKTISTVGATERSSSHDDGVGGDPTVRTLDFSAFSSDIPLGLDADDGLAYFNGYIGTRSSHYAGIFSTTDLGAPITGNNFRATWAGKFQFNHFLPKDFTLDVTFGGTTGTVVGLVIDFLADEFDFLIDGTFDENGVITGGARTFSSNVTTATAALALSTARDGAISGIIGQSGAVGVFYGTGAGRPYSGGFVAAPAR